MAAIVNNLSTNYTLYYNVLNFFKVIMDNHPSLGHVTQGDIPDFDTREYPEYPIGNIQILTATFGTSITTYSCQLIIADKQKNKNNESIGVENKQTIPFYGVDDLVDIHANTLGILNDLTSFLQNGVDAFQITGDIVCEPFADRFNNGLAGWVGTFDLITHNSKDRCLFNLYP